MSRKFVRGGARHACRACGASVTSNYDFCSPCKRIHATPRAMRHAATQRRQRYVKQPQTIAGLDRLDQLIEVPTKS